MHVEFFNGQSTSVLSVFLLLFAIISITSVVLASEVKLILIVIFLFSVISFRMDWYPVKANSRV